MLHDSTQRTQLDGNTASTEIKHYLTSNITPTRPRLSSQYIRTAHIRARKLIASKATQHKQINPLIGLNFQSIALEQKGGPYLKYPRLQLVPYR